MPIYVFECSQCGTVYERFMKVDEKYDILECPSCGETKISPHKFK
jgi:putative FmdB family regulatory protein